MDRSQYPEVIWLGYDTFASTSMPSPEPALPNIKAPDLKEIEYGFNCIKRWARTAPGWLDNYHHWAKKVSDGVKAGDMEGIETWDEFIERMDADAKREDNDEPQDQTLRGDENDSNDGEAPTAEELEAAEEVAEEAEWAYEEASATEPEYSMKLAVLEADRDEKRDVYEALRLQDQKAREKQRAARERACPEKKLQRQLEDCLKLMRAGALKAKEDPEIPTEYCIPDGPIPELETIPQSDGTYFKLRPHQRDGIGLMEHLEADHGSWILADEPGLGKTAQVGGLIARSKSGTLIVCPKPLLPMWETFFERMPSKTVLVYYGDNKKKISLDELRSADVVLTTYEIVRAEGDDFMRAQEDFHLLRKGETHKWVPLSKQLRKRRNRANRKQSGNQPPYVLSSDGKSEQRKLDSKRASGKLFAIDWYRIVLEEAHRIKARDSGTSKAAAKLSQRAKFKGCITGTPFQNDYSDFQAILRFMHVEPFCRYNLFKRCFMKKSKRQEGSTSAAALKNDLELVLIALRRCLTVRRTGDQNFAGHQISGLMPLQRYEIPVKLGPKNQAIQDETAELWDLAHRSVHGCKIPFEELYKALQQALLAAINPHLCNARYGDCGLNDGHDEDSVLDIADPDAGSDPTGSLQRDAVAESSRANLAHYTRKPAVKADFSPEEQRKKYIDEMEKTKSYKSEVIDTMANSIARVIKKEEYDATSQASALDIKTYRMYGKIIAFCMFLCGNDALKLALKERGIEAYEINGFTSDTERAQILRDFEELDDQGQQKDMSDPSVQPGKVRVLLASPRIAAEGLNLKKASHVFFMGFHWNPFVEIQAYHRAYRIGQTRKVSVYWVFAGLSIHERVHRLQLVKLSKEVSMMKDERLRESAAKIATMPAEYLRNLIDRIGGADEDSDDDEDEDESRWAKRMRQKATSRDSDTESLSGFVVPDGESEDSDDGYVE